MVSNDIKTVVKIIFVANPTLFSATIALTPRLLFHSLYKLQLGPNLGFNSCENIKNWNITSQLFSTTYLGVGRLYFWGMLCFWKWLRIRLAWRNSNKRVSLSFKQCGSRSPGVMHYSCYAHVFWLDSHHADFSFTFSLVFFRLTCYLYGLQ